MPFDSYLNCECELCRIKRPITTDESPRTTLVADLLFLRSRFVTSRKLMLHVHTHTHTRG